MSNDLTIKSQAVGRALQHYQSVVDDFDREMARILGVNRTDVRCLEMLITNTDDELTPRDIAAHLNLTAGSVTTMLDRLERVGYVTRSRHASDRRKVLVEATPRVTELAWSMMSPMLDDANAEVISHFTLDQLDTIEEFVTRATEVQRRHVERLRGRESA
jgi:DNA-binding MarR family transcriptional regulator